MYRKSCLIGRKIHLKKNGVTKTIRKIKTVTWTKKWMAVNTVLRFRARGTQPPQRGVSLRTGRRDDTMWIPTGRIRKTVLEFVAVGELSKASLCSGVKGGGKNHKFGCYKRTYK